MWFAKNEPDVWSKTRSIVGSYDFIAMKLCGERGVESNWALESGLFDLEAGSWAEDIVEASGGRLALLPPVRKPDEVVGELSVEAAQATGLRAGIPVVAGCADHIGSAFAAGLLDDGDLLIKLGGAGDILLTVDEPLVDDRLFLDFHLVPGSFVSNGCMATSGSLVRWFQEQLAGGEALAVLDREAAAAGAGAGGIVALPYFLGEKTPINDPTATGAFVGLRLTHTRGHLFRAVLEGVAFGFRHHLDVFKERGHAPLRVRVTDGGSQSPVWNQVIADVLGVPLEKVALRSGSAVAAAFAAGIGVGAFKDWHDIGRFVSVTEVIEPADPQAYEHNYDVYRALYPSLREVLA
jgi:xylulokinase